MNRGIGLILALAVLIGPVACASGGGGGDTSRPSANRWTRAAERDIAMAMLQPDPERQLQHYQAALQQVEEGLENDPENASLWLLLGQVSVGLADIPRADSAFTRAEELHPEFRAEIEVDRENAWIEAYNEGAQALQADDVENAIRHFELADRIYRARPDARVILGWLYSTQGETDKAVQAYQGALDVMRGPRPDWLTEEHEADWRDQEETAALALAELLSNAGRVDDAARVYRQFLEHNPEHLSAKVQYAVMLSMHGRAEEASAVYAELDRDDLTEQQQFLVGVGLFQAEDYDAAAAAFRRSIRMNPYSRDAHYNLAQALFVRTSELEDALQQASGEQANRIRTDLHGVYEEIQKATETVLELDPLNRNVLLLLARAYRGFAELAPDAQVAENWRRRIVGVLERHDQMLYEVTDVNVALETGRVTVSGMIENHGGDPGAPVRLRVSVLDETGAAVANEIVTVTAPAREQSTTFRVAIRTPATVKGWKYEVVQ